MKERVYTFNDLYPETSLQQYPLYNQYVLHQSHTHAHMVIIDPFLATKQKQFWEASYKVVYDRFSAGNSRTAEQKAEFQKQKDDNKGWVFALTTSNPYMRPYTDSYNPQKANEKYEADKAVAQRIAQELNKIPGAVFMMDPRDEHAGEVNRYFYTFDPLTPKQLGQVLKLWIRNELLLLKDPQTHEPHPYIEQIKKNHKEKLGIEKEADVKAYEEAFRQGFETNIATAHALGCVYGMAHRQAQKINKEEQKDLQALKTSPKRPSEKSVLVDDKNAQEASNLLKQKIAKRRNENASCLAFVQLPQDVIKKVIIGESSAEAHHAFDLGFNNGTKHPKHSKDQVKKILEKGLQKPEPGNKGSCIMM